MSKEDDYIDNEILCTDGCGMMLSEYSDGLIEVNLLDKYGLCYVKGLLQPFNFKRFIEEQNR